MTNLASNTRETVLTLCGEALVPHALGGLYWEREGLLIVSDLHLEKGSSLAAKGVLLPPYDSRTTLARLAELCRIFAPRRVVALGDSFHDIGGPERLDEGDRKTLLTLTESRDWVWITGNHDPEVPEDLGGEAITELQVGPFIFRHEPTGETGEIAGHLHPCASVSTRGRRLRRRCFISDETSLIMPAFGAFTGGLDVLDEAFAPFFPGHFHAWLMGEEGVYPVSRAKLETPTDGPGVWRLS